MMLDTDVSITVEAGIYLMKGLFDYQIRIHNESESEVNPTPNSDPYSL